MKKNGYYIYEPVIFKERFNGIPDYLIKAIYFHEKDRFLTASKYKQNPLDAIFQKEDFSNSNLDSSRYEFDNDKLCLHLDIGKPWEDKFYYKRISDKEFISERTKDRLRFIPWHEEE
ncbi:hypothetical protein [Roseivirga sp. UBA1976]|uniref:hypothetical protein n=1 Tax=Roseivirga sp. UBA1976 TaxID=1947386 RepID=UPI00257ADD6E|nr:hypothetical protein [Roseivirga sp. UBA1976]|tara:strand:- start:1252 stop:1602 length:351 start_codon:yes stop_codon:yes gene_type:complete